MHSLIHKKKIISLMETNKYSVIGIMSGTSCDGLDITYCDFWKKKNNWFYKLQYCEDIEYEKGLKNKLIKCYKMSGLDPVGTLWQHNPPCITQPLGQPNLQVAQLLTPVSTCKVHKWSSGVARWRAPGYWSSKRWWWS